MLTDIKYSDDGAIEFKLIATENEILHVSLESPLNYFPALLKINGRTIADGEPIVKSVVESIEYWFDTLELEIIRKVGQAMINESELDHTDEGNKLILKFKKVLVLRNYIWRYYVK